MSFALRAVLGLAMAGLPSDGHGQVQVSQEPRHHKVLENAYVRVLDVRIPPHDTTMMHKHSTPSVFVMLSHVKSGSEVLIEPGQPTTTHGGIWFEGFYNKPRVHRVWNEDTAEFHVMDIELLHPPEPIAVNSTPYAESLFDEKPVYGLRVTLPANKRFDISKLVCPVLIIGLSGPDAAGLVNGQRFTKKGDFIFIPAGSTIHVSNNSKTGEQQFALFYLK